MSTSHFARAFKNATGHPPHLYLTTERLRLAQSMLSEGSLPLVDIAARVGFQTQQHFTEVFHRYAGCTPRASVLRTTARRSDDALATGSVSDQQAQKSDTFRQELERIARLADVSLTKCAA
nr:helix-turn-helix transcriptional regulator [Paraburkholderia sp. BL8N3]